MPRLRPSPRPMAPRERKHFTMSLPRDPCARLASPHCFARFALLALACAVLSAGAACDAVRLTGSGNNAPGQFGFGNDAAAPASAEAAQTESVARDIEEADVVKVVGDRVYVLNRYKGLIIIDVSDPDQPTVLGTFDLRGRGVEMYVVADRVFALLSADFFFYADVLPVLGGAEPGVAASPPLVPQSRQPDFEGSQLAIVDVSDPTQPESEGKINLVGYASQSRRVGDIIYVVGTSLAAGQSNGDTQSSDDGAFVVSTNAFVASVNVADPANPVPVQRETFEGDNAVIHVSTTTIFAGSSEYDFDTGDVSTRVTAIDISDPAGAINVRGDVLVPGSIRNRFNMDEFDGALRVVTQSTGFGFREVALYTYDVTDLDDILPLGSVDIIQNESLEAVRFDGPRGYAVTFFRVDPLFVLDLSDPANPAVTGELEVPGWSTHIEPRGDRLIAVGIDDTDGQRPAVAYYDVSDPSSPQQLSRVILGPPGSYTESEATYDEKAFKVVDELNLIAIPFRHVEYPAGPTPVPGEPTPFDDSPPGAGEGSDSSSPGSAAEINQPICQNAVQLVDFSDTALVQRGMFEHRGRVERVGVIDGRVFALSQASFQMVDIADRDAPASTGVADFFTDEEMPYYADDCGYIYFGGIDEGFGQAGTLAQLLASLLNNCGATGALPMAGIVSGFVGMARVRRRRQRI